VTSETTKISTVVIVIHWSLTFRVAKFSAKGATTAGQWCGWGTRWLWTATMTSKMA